MAIAYSDAFKHQLKRLSRRYRRIRFDIQPIVEQLEAGDTPGDQIQCPGYTVYKVRARNSAAERGKRGGYRIIYYLETEIDILLITIYSKTDQSDIKPDEIRRIISKEGNG